MSEIPGISERAPQRPISVNQVGDMAKALGLTEDSQVLAKEIAGLLASQPNVRISNMSTATPPGQVGVPTGPTGVPTLDNPDDVKQKEVDLAKLISYLQLDNDKRQAELAKDRIQLQQNTMDQRHAQQMEKIDESLAEMDKAAKTGLAMKIFGWIMAAVAVAIAVAACVATGGVAVGAVVGAVIAIGMCVANETGAMNSLTEAIASGFEKMGLSKEAAQILAAVTTAVLVIAVTVAGGAGGSAIAGLFSSAAKGAATATQAVVTSSMATAKAWQSGLQISAAVLGVGTTATAGYAGVQNYKATMLQSETTETEKFMAMMQQQISESQEELEKILSQIQSCYGDIAAIINSSIDTEKEIAEKTGQMA